MGQELIHQLIFQQRKLLVVERGNQMSRLMTCQTAGLYIPPKLKIPCANLHKSSNVVQSFRYQGGIERIECFIGKH